MFVEHTFCVEYTNARGTIDIFALIFIYFCCALHMAFASFRILKNPDRQKLSNYCLIWRWQPSVCDALHCTAAASICGQQRLYSVVLLLVDK